MFSLCDCESEFTTRDFLSLLCLTWFKLRIFLMSDINTVDSGANTMKLFAVKFLFNSFIFLFGASNSNCVMAVSLQWMKS